MVKLIHASDVPLGITYAGIGTHHHAIARVLHMDAFDDIDSVVNKAIDD